MKTQYLTDIDSIESNSISIINDLSKEDNINNIFVFPDIHISTKDSIPVGTAFSTNIDIIYPLIYGKDLGCGVAYTKIDKKYFNKFDKLKIYNNFYKEHLNFTDEGLGSGNHFLSIEESDTYLYIIVHTGTRNNGIYFYQKSKQYLDMYRNASDLDVNYMPIDYLLEIDDNYFNEYNKMLEYGKLRRTKFIQKTVEWLRKGKYLTLSILDNYEIFDSIHNYIEIGDTEIIHRKGVSGFSDKSDIIACPISMFRGTEFVKLNYSYALNSCAHGAGRKFSRFDALNYWKSSMKKKEREFYYDNYKEYLTDGEFSSDIITEFDFAYKDITNLYKNQPHITKVDSSKPIITIKTIT